MKARAAGSFGSSGEAAKGYAAALARFPDSQLLAARTFSEALAAGDRALALRAARLLRRSDEVAPEVRLLLLSDAVSRRDWKEAQIEIAAIEKDEVFGFMAPILRAWTAFGARKGDPLALLAQAETTSPIAASYAGEHRPLLLLAGGQHATGAEELQTFAKDAGLRAQRLRIAGAALLAEEGEEELALSLLEGPAPAVAKARSSIQSGKDVPGAIERAEDGIAELLVRIAGDLYRQKMSDVALRFARLSTFLAPKSSETWIVTADILGSEERHEAALQALGQVSDADPFIGNARDGRVKLLLDSGRPQAAVQRAEQAAKTGEAGFAEWIRLADLYSELERHGEAAAAYGRALELAAGQEQYPLWVLHLQRGGALEQAERWAEAKGELETAYKLAPDQPLVLNYLGYAQLERRENIDEAMALIAKASELQPDSPEITDSLGWAHYLQGDLAKAVELLERAVAGQPADPEINEHLGDAYYRSGRHFEARYAWRAALIYAEGESAERLRAKIDAGLTPELASP